MNGLPGDTQTILHQPVGVSGGKLDIGSQKRCELGHTVIRHFTRGELFISNIHPIYLWMSIYLLILSRSISDHHLRCGVGG